MDDVSANLDGQDGLVVLREALEDMPRGRLYDGATKPASPKPASAKKPWWKFW